MTPKDRRLIRDMIENAHVAIDHSCGVDVDTFDRVHALKYVVLYAILVVGEAASKVSLSLTQAHPEVPWDEIVATRHFVAHGYDKVSPATLVQIAQEDMPVLIDALREILRLEPST